MKIFWIGQCVHIVWNVSGSALHQAFGWKQLGFWHFPQQFEGFIISHHEACLLLLLQHSELLHFCEWKIWEQRNSSNFILQEAKEREESVEASFEEDNGSTHLISLPFSQKKGELLVKILAEFMPMLFLSADCSCEFLGGCFHQFIRTSSTCSKKAIWWSWKKDC